MSVLCLYIWWKNTKDDQPSIDFDFYILSSSDNLLNVSKFELALSTMLITEMSSFWMKSTKLAVFLPIFKGNLTDYTHPVVLNVWFSHRIRLIRTVMVQLTCKLTEELP